MSKAMLAETKGEEVAVQTEEEMFEEDKAYIEQVFSRHSTHPVLCTMCDTP